MFCEFVHPQSIKTIITGIHSDKGVIIVSLFENQKKFKSDQPALVKIISKEDLKDGTLITVLNNLPPNIYGIAVLDDENENGEMDYRFKRPIEGFGFSNYYHKGLFRPRFDDFSFELGEEEVIIEVVMRYIKETK